MNFRRILTTILLAVLCLESGAQDRQFPVLKRFHGQRMPNKTRVLEENAILKARIDSLCGIVDSLSIEASKADSLSAQLAEYTKPKASFLQSADYTTELTDSLLIEWYERPLPELGEYNGENLDSFRFTSNVPDSVFIERLKKMNSFISLPFNYTVKNYMVLYSEKMPTKMSRMLGLSKFYFPIFEEILDKYDLPQELEYMAIIESALNTTAQSRAGARGIWQFMYRSARQYGLKINSFVDERLDVEKAADAAARYLRDAYNIFGDWSLAISSYNCGSGNVNKAIKRSGGHRDFWSIYPYLPRETRGYMPAFVGAMYAFTYYKEYGLEPQSIDLPAHADTFEICRNLHFKQLNEVLGIPMEDLKELNPQYTHEIIPGDSEKFILKLPYNYTNAFIDAQDTIYAHRADTLLSATVLKNISEGSTGSSEAIRYKVKSGDSLGRIASRNHVTVSQLKKWNHLKSDKIRIGQILTIYRK